MKTVFIFFGISLLAGGCIDFAAGTMAGETEGGTAGGSGVDGACGDHCPMHDLSGELMLFVNGRLSNADALWTSNIPRPDKGTFIGPAFYLYDPLRTCDDGGNACRMVRLGSVLLDDTLGPISVHDGSLQKFTIRDLAWHPEQGLWGVTYDTQNDEWGMADLTVPDWTRTGNLIGIQRYAFRPGDAQAPGTDPCYWQNSVSGLAFFGDQLTLGVRGLGGQGIPANGEVFRIALDVIRQEGYCRYAPDTSNDPHYYACDVLCHDWAEFVPQLGVAGDMENSSDGTELLAVVRSEDQSLMPLDRQALYGIDPPPGGKIADPSPMGTYAQPVPHGLDIEGLARIEGRLFGIDVWGKIYEFDEVGHTVREHDDLSGLFDDYQQSLKIRGATRVVIP